MKTKKEIVAWWKALGNQEFKNDFAELQENLAPEIKVDRFFDQSNIRLTLSKSSWKFPLKLYFNLDGENIDCFRIVGF